MQGHLPPRACRRRHRDGSWPGRGRAPGPALYPRSGTSRLSYRCRGPASASCSSRCFGFCLSCGPETGVLLRRVSCRSRRVRVPAALQPQAGAGLSPGRVGGRALARVSSAVRLSESSCRFCHVPSLTCSPHCGSFTRSEAQAQCAAPHALRPPPRRRVWPPVAPVAVRTQVPCPRHASRE